MKNSYYYGSQRPFYAALAHRKKKQVSPNRSKTANLKNGHKPLLWVGTVGIVMARQWKNTK